MSNVNSVRLETVEFSVADPTSFGQIVLSFFSFCFVFILNLSSDDTFNIKMATTEISKSDFYHKLCLCFKKCESLLFLQCHLSMKALSWPLCEMICPCY